MSTLNKHRALHSLLHLFVKECEAIYGPEFLSYNTHNLIHLPDDVLRFGSLPNFAAYPFENYLQVLKKMLRKCDRPLQQIVRRVTELENVKTSFKKQDTGVKRCIFVENISVAHWYLVSILVSIDNICTQKETVGTE